MDEYEEVAHYYAERHQARIEARQDEALRCRTASDVLLTARDDYAAMRRAIASNGLDY